jgi:hypothetical protein
MLRINRQRMPSLEPKPEVSTGVRGIVGFLVLALGLAVLVGAVRSLILDIATWGQAVVLTLLVLFCLLAVHFGWRLLFNRPNVYGSIMGPTAWRIWATVLLVTTGVAAALQLKFIGGVSWKLLGLLSVAGACAAKAEHMIRRGEITYDRPTSR